jgi:hypothetical protein
VPSVPDPGTPATEIIGTSVFVSFATEAGD